MTERKMNGSAAFKLFSVISALLLLTPAGISYAQEAKDKAAAVESSSEIPTNLDIDEDDLPESNPMHYKHKWLRVADTKLYFELEGGGAILLEHFTSGRSAGGGYGGLNFGLANISQGIMFNFDVFGFVGYYGYSGGGGSAFGGGALEPGVGFSFGRHTIWDIRLYWMPGVFYVPAAYLNTSTSFWTLEALHVRAGAYFSHKYFLGLNYRMFHTDNFTLFMPSVTFGF